MCCALHKWLLDVDGLDEKWEEGEQIIWEGHSGVTTFLMLRITFQMQFLVLCHLRQCVPIMCREDIVNNNVPIYDQTCLTREERRQHEQHDSRMSVRVVKDLSLSYFRHKLVQHFDIAFLRNEIIWPGRRNRQKEQSELYSYKTNYYYYYFIFVVIHCHAAAYQEDPVRHPRYCQSSKNYLPSC